MSKTSATSCHRKKWLIMLDVEYWDIKSLSQDFMLSFKGFLNEDLGNL